MVNNIYEIPMTIKTTDKVANLSFYLRQFFLRLEWNLSHNLKF